MSNYASYNSIDLYTRSAVPPIYENPTITNMPTTPSYLFANYQTQSGVGAQPLAYRNPCTTNYMEFPNFAQPVATNIHNPSPLMEFSEYTITIPPIPTFAGYQAQVGTNTQLYSNPCTTNYLGLDFRSSRQLTANVACTDTNFEGHQVSFLVPRTAALSDNPDQAPQMPAATSTDFSGHQVPFLIPYTAIPPYNYFQALRDHYLQYPSPLDNIPSNQDSSTSSSDDNQTNPFDATVFYDQTNPIFNADLAFSDQQLL